MPTPRRLKSRLSNEQQTVRLRAPRPVPPLCPTTKHRTIHGHASAASPSLCTAIGPGCNWGKAKPCCGWQRTDPLGMAIGRHQAEGASQEQRLCALKRIQKKRGLRSRGYLAKRGWCGRGDPQGRFNAQHVPGAGPLSSFSGHGQAREREGSLQESLMQEGTLQERWVRRAGRGNLEGQVGPQHVPGAGPLPELL